MFVKRFVRKLSGDTFYLRFLPDTCPIYDCLYLFTADLLMIRRLLSIPVLFAASCLCTCCIWITIRLSISIHSRPSDDHTAGCRHTSVASRHLSLHVLYMFLLLPRAGRTAAAVVVAIAAFTFFGSYERLREGVRKPFLIHSHLFSNGLLVEQIESVNGEGMTAHSGWVAARAGDGAEVYGRAVFKAQCASCHTLDGYQAIRPLLPTNADLLAVVADDPAGSGARAFKVECASCHADYTYEDLKDLLPGADEIREDPEFYREFNAAMISATSVEDAPVALEQQRFGLVETTFRRQAVA